MAVTAQIHIFGIRHHGPGSARSVLQALDSLMPDAVLVEGPADASDVLPLLGRAEMKPPVALLIYALEHPEIASYYPFAIFSPEYQAIRYALERNVRLRFMDLPARHWLMRPEREAQDEAEAPIRQDPLGELAKAAGYDDAERWWDAMVEQRHDSQDVFAALLEGMAALREAYAEGNAPFEAAREAHMRQSIRQAIADGCQRIAVVCGAWHGPALRSLDNAAEDAALLRDLPSIEIESTWVPWTHGRLARASGYGAGVRSPGWYEFLWTTQEGVTTRWLTRVAQLLREKDLDASPAQVIDAVRLADTLASFRGRSVPDLHDLNEVALTVFCFGNDAPMQIIHDELIVGDKIGDVPDDAPMVPLQRDFMREQKRLKLRAEPVGSALKLDLRNPLHRERSHLLHRLFLLGIPWGNPQDVAGKTGTFHEVWQLEWQPEWTIRLVEKSIWGNVIGDAATGYAIHLADTSSALPALTLLVRDVLLANLPEAVPRAVKRLEDEAAVSGDIAQLMAALPPLVDLLLYGSARQTDVEAIRGVVDGMVTRVCVGLPGECATLDDDAAAAMMNALITFDGALRVLDNADYLSRWQGVLAALVAATPNHGRVRGRSCRILVDSRAMEADEGTRQVGLALTGAAKPEDAAEWLTGFLHESGAILIHDDRLLQIIDTWVMAQASEQFDAVLPLLRRTFSTFTDPEIRQIGRRISGQPLKRKQGERAELDEARADLVLDTLAELLGIPRGGNDHEQL